jgi:hypothetical protein
MTKQTSKPIVVLNRPTGIAVLTVALLSIGAFVGHRFALESPRQAMRAEIERELDRKYSDDQFSLQSYVNVALTNDLVRRIRARPSEMNNICKQQLLQNIYRLSNFKTHEPFDSSVVEHELWVSLELLEISSVDEFTELFKSSDVYDKCEEYFNERPDGREHFRRLLALVDDAIANDELHQQFARNGNSGG